MMTYLIGGLALAALCGGWAVVQRWIANRDPEVRGPEHSVGCGGCGGCTGTCATGHAEPELHQLAEPAESDESPEPVDPPRAIVVSLDRHPDTHPH